MSQILVKNGTLVTMNPGREILPADILIKGDRIHAIGPDIDVPATPDIQVIDARGKVVIPGLIQPHIHLTQTLFRGLSDDLELLDWLKKRIWPLEASHTYESNMISARLGIAELIMGGTTAIVDMGTVHHTAAICETVRDTGFRAVVGKCMMDHGTGVPQGLMEDTDHALKESTALMHQWHNSASGRIRYAFAPRFVVSCSEKLLLRVRDIANDNQALIHTHASENQGEIALVEQERGMRNVTYLKHLGITGENLILAHCIWLDPEEMQILNHTGTKVAHCPTSNMKLASGVARVPELLEAGTCVSVAADGAPCNNNLSIFTEMRHAALIQKVNRLSPTAMPAHQVFEMATLGGARAMGQAHELGSLEPGKKADLAIVDLNTPHACPGTGRDPVSRLVYSATARDVVFTIINGKVVMENRRLTTIDLPETLKASETACQDIMERAWESGFRP